MKKNLFIAAALLFTLSVNAQQKVIPLYTGAAPGSESWTWQEATVDAFGSKAVYNVSSPSLTVFRADTNVQATGAAVIICPGGAF
ncbi:MAG: hypothetical protein ABIN95_13220, partial [Mucilaginibacter sp.]